MERPRHLTANTLLDALDREAKQGERIACVIDPSRYGGEDGAAGALGMDDAAFGGLINFHSGFAMAHRPMGPRWVVPDEGLQLERLASMAVERQGVTFLFSSDSTDSVVEHLHTLAKLEQPDGSKLLFRWHDAFVLSALAPLLSARQEAALLGPISRWLLLDACRHEVQLGGTDHRQAGFQSLRLDTNQLDGLSNAMLPFTIFDQVDDIDSAILSGLDECERLRRIAPLLQRGRLHGLSAEEDLSLFVALALQLPADFDQAGPVARALERARAGPLGFGEAIDQVPVEEWRAWDEELDAGSEGDG